MLGELDFEKYLYYYPEVSRFLVQENPQRKN